MAGNSDFFVLLLLSLLKNGAGAGGGAKVTAKSHDGDIYVVRAHGLIEGFDSSDDWTLDHQAIFRKAAATFVNVTASEVVVKIPVAEAAHRLLGSSSSSAHGFAFDWEVLSSKSHASKAYERIQSVCALCSDDLHRQLATSSNDSYTEALDLFVQSWEGVYVSLDFGISPPYGMGMAVTGVTSPEEYHEPLHAEDHGCGVHASKSIFELGDDLNPKFTMQALLFLVMLTMVFERGTHILEHRISTHPHLMSMYSKMTTELTILGLISFFLTIFIQSGVVEHGEQALLAYSRLRVSSDAFIPVVIQVFTLVFIPVFILDPYIPLLAWP
jgi:hypothetical protein